jgi:hypothetical protein
MIRIKKYIFYQHRTEVLVVEECVNFENVDSITTSNGSLNAQLLSHEQSQHVINMIIILLSLFLLALSSITSVFTIVHPTFEKGLEKFAT